MPSWFSKVFKNGSTQAKPRAASGSLDQLMGGIDTTEDAPAAPAAPDRKRRVVQAPVLEITSEAVEAAADIRIKGRPDATKGSCVFMIDRPVLDGYSAWFPRKETASASPLAETLFAIDGVESVLIHGFTVTVTRRPTMHGDWTPLARDIGNAIRAHLIEGKPVVSEVFLRELPDEEVIEEKLQRIIDFDINPSIAAHSGSIALDRVEGNTVYIQMMGGCQGCAASDVTLRQGIYESFRNAVPQIGAILDTTDHTAGKNPFYREMPAGMS